MNDKIKLKRGTSVQWAAANPILLQGEPGIDTTENKVKYGDGTTAWSGLSFSGGAGNFQPLDSDLTAIASLTTTSFGRSLLTQADAAATRTTIGAGTSSFDGAYSSLTGIPSTFTPASHNHAATEITSGTLPVARLSFTKAELDTAVSDGNVLYVGDVTSNATHTGDVTGATALTIADAAVTLAKMANLAQDQFIGRTTASTGAPQTATITAAARTVLDDATVADMVNTIGGAAATGTGGLVRATSPTLVTPNIGASTGTSLVLSGSASVGSQLNFPGFAIIGVGGSTAKLSVSSATGGTALGNYAGQSIEPANGLRVPGKVIIGASGDDGAMLQVTGNITASGTITLGTYTVGTLPSASANTRARAFASDSNLAFNSTNLGSTVTAGGSTLVPVFSNGTNWVIG